MKYFSDLDNLMLLGAGILFVAFGLSLLPVFPFNDKPKKLKSEIVNEHSDYEESAPVVKCGASGPPNGWLCQELKGHDGNHLYRPTEKQMQDAGVVQPMRGCNPSLVYVDDFSFYPDKNKFQILDGSIHINKKEGLQINPGKTYWVPSFWR